MPLSALRLAIVPMVLRAAGWVRVQCLSSANDDRGGGLCTSCKQLQCLLALLLGAQSTLRLLA